MTFKIDTRNVTNHKQVCYKKKTKAEVAPTDGTPARNANPENKNWVELSDDERRSNWGNILDAYRKR